MSGVGNLNTVLQALLEDKKIATTLKDGYAVLPNGLKLCWGIAINKKYGDKVTLPISFEQGIYMMQPNYNMDFTMRCTFGSLFFSGNQITVVAYDVVERTPSARGDLNAVYFVIGY